MAEQEINEKQNGDEEKYVAGGMFEILRRSGEIFFWWNQSHDAPVGIIDGVVK